MFALKRFVRSPGAVITLAAICLSTSAHAAWDGHGWGGDPNNNGWGFGGPVHNGPGGPINNGLGGPGGVGGVGGVGSVGGFRGIGPGQHFGLSSYGASGMDPFAANLGVGPQNNGWGVSGGSPIYNAMFGINPYSSFGWVPIGLGVNPWPTPQGVPQTMGLPTFNPWMGMNPQQNLSFGPFPALGMYPQQSMGILMPPHFGMAPQSRDVNWANRPSNSISIKGSARLSVHVFGVMFKSCTRNRIN